MGKSNCTYESFATIWANGSATTYPKASDLKPLSMVETPQSSVGYISRTPVTDSNTDVNGGQVPVRFGDEVTFYYPVDQDIYPYGYDTVGDSYVGAVTAESSSSGFNNSMTIIIDSVHGLSRRGQMIKAGDTCYLTAVLPSATNPCPGKSNNTCTYYPIGVDLDTTYMYLFPSNAALGGSGTTQCPAGGMPGDNVPFQFTINIDDSELTSLGYITYGAQLTLTNNANGSSRKETHNYVSFPETPGGGGGDAPNLVIATYDRHIPSYKLANGNSMTQPSTPPSDCPAGIWAPNSSGTYTWFLDQNCSDGPHIYKDYHTGVAKEMTTDCNSCQSTQPPPACDSSCDSSGCAACCCPNLKATETCVWSSEAGACTASSPGTTSCAPTDCSPTCGFFETCTQNLTTGKCECTFDSNWIFYIGVAAMLILAFIFLSG